MKSVGSKVLILELCRDLLLANKIGDEVEYERCRYELGLVIELSKEG